MKNILIRIGILAGIFVLAVGGFSYLTNKGNTDMTADIAGASVPRLMVAVSGYGMERINPLVGYKTEMNITTMRDSITPIGTDGKLSIIVEDSKSQDATLEYELYSLDGKKSLYKDKIKNVQNSIDINLGNKVERGQEKILKLIYSTGVGKQTIYYTRVIDATEYKVAECLNYVKNFHDSTFDKGKAKELMGAMEPNEQADNTTYQKTTINSNYEQLSWGELAPKPTGDIQWSIKEITGEYVAVQAVYQVNCTGATGENERYNVNEFFKVKSGKGKVYLLDYERIMNQIFCPEKPTLTEKGIPLGITSPKVTYQTNKDGTIVSFVQERELWNYNRAEDQISLVFSFARAENEDVRNLYDQHQVHIVDVDKKGNTIFGVSGYMNRGIHEGEVGISIYYFDIEKNVVEEKVFIPSNKSYMVTQEEIGKLVYFSNDQSMLYVMVTGSLYKINLKEDTKEVLVKNLAEGQYVASEDGHLLAYQNGNVLEQATEVTVLNLMKGEEKTVTVDPEENIRPLGFVMEDFIYGVAKQSDRGKTISGEDVTPMYKVEIRDKKNKVVKTYQVDQKYILDVFIEDHMITMNRVTKKEAVYVNETADYITNNTEKKKSNIFLESIEDEKKETQQRLSYENGIKDRTPKLLQPKQVIFENPTTISFDTSGGEVKYYVYGKGILMGIYDKAGYAVQKADEIGGVVVSSNQEYVWESGNRKLQYVIEDMTPFADVISKINAGTAIVDVLDQFSDGKALDFTGCTVEEMLYVINQGTPVVAMIDHSHAIILMGYGKSSVTYIEPDSGTRVTKSMPEIEDMLKASGGTLVGYLMP
ncbi:MAG: hypothetical protein RR920_06140 [Lachnospiraceae bacterium]